MVKISAFDSEHTGSTPVSPSNLPIDFVDQLWDALRHVCCASKPATDAKTIVMVRRTDIAAAIGLIRNGPGM